MSSIPKSRQILTDRHEVLMWQSFNLEKITGILKIKVFLKNCKYLPFASKKTCPKENSKLKHFKHFILGLQNEQNGS